MQYRMYFAYCFLTTTRDCNAEQLPLCSRPLNLGKDFLFCMRFGVISLCHNIRMLAEDLCNGGELFAPGGAEGCSTNKPA